MRPATQIAALIFSIMTLGHVLRLVFGVSVAVGGVSVPMWVSVVAAVGLGALAWLLWREARAPVPTGS